MPRYRVYYTRTEDDYIEVDADNEKDAEGVALDEIRDSDIQIESIEELD